MTIPILTKNIIDDFRSYAKRLSIIERSIAGNTAVLSKVSRTTTQSITTATSTGLIFDNVVDDPYGLWDAGLPSQLTVKASGIYFVDFMVEWDGNATGQRRAAVRKNAVNVDAYGSDAFPIVAAATYNSVTGIFSLAAGDFVDAYVRQTSGVNLNISITSTPPTLTLIRLNNWSIE